MRKECELYRNLWANVFKKAIEDLSYKAPEFTDELMGYQNSHMKQELYWKRQARAWFKSNSKLFNSFEGICLILGFEPYEIRKKLHEDGLL